MSCARGQLELCLVVFLIWKLEVIKPSRGSSCLVKVSWWHLQIGMGFTSSWSELEYSQLEPARPSSWLAATIHQNSDHSPYFKLSWTGPCHDIEESCTSSCTSYKDGVNKCFNSVWLGKEILTRKNSGWQLDSSRKTRRTYRTLRPFFQRSRQGQGTKKKKKKVQ